MSGFSPATHFASVLMARCERCERVGEGSWPAGWVMGSDGIRCGPCYAPTLLAWQDGEIVPLSQVHDGPEPEHWKEET